MAIRGRSMLGQGISGQGICGHGIDGSPRSQSGSEIRDSSQTRMAAPMIGTTTLPTPPTTCRAA